MVLLVSSHCEVRNHVKLHLQKAVQKTEVCHIKTKHLVNSLLSLDLKDDRRGIRSKSVSTTRMFPEVFSFAFTSSSSFSSSASSTEKLMSPPLFCKENQYSETKLLSSSYLMDSWESDSCNPEICHNKTFEIFFFVGFTRKWQFVICCCYKLFTWNSRLFSTPPWAGVSFRQ